MILENSYASFINLDHRPDRLAHMKSELSKLGIEATRTRGMLPEEYTGDFERVKVMNDRTKGAIGCHFSQVKVMQDALAQNKHAFVMEDDLVFCKDFQQRMKIVDGFLENREWDVFWLGGTYHIPAVWHKKGHEQLPQCNCLVNADATRTDNDRIVRTFGIWSTYAYIVNVNSIPKILELLDHHLHISIGIDWLFILLQPRLNTFAFVPGMVKQYDNKSDIGNGITKFRGFRGLGGHWYQDDMRLFNPSKLKL